MSGPQHARTTGKPFIPRGSGSVSAYTAAGLLANRPVASAGNAGGLYLATDDLTDGPNGTLWNSNGATWSMVPKTLGGVMGWFNIGAYGADSTGAADSTTAMRNAATAAGAAGTVYAPAGTYTITGLTDFGLHTSLVCAGFDSVLFNTSTGATNAFRWLGTGSPPETGWGRGFTVAGFKLLHTGSAAPIRVERCLNFEISDVWAQGNSTVLASGNGIEMVDSYAATITNSRAHTFGGSGWRIQSTGVTQPGQFLFLNCSARFNGLYGWDYLASSGLIDSCHHEACISSSNLTRGVSVVNSAGGGNRNFSFHDHHFEDSSTSNTQVGFYQAGNDCRNLELDGGFFTKVQTPIQLVGTVNGCKIGRIDAITSGVTSPAAYVITTNSAVASLELGHIENHAYTGIYDGLASSSTSIETFMVGAVGGLPRVVARTADSAARNSGNTGTTLTNDDTLLWTVAANEIDFVEVFLLVSAANATMDFKASFSQPAGGTFVIGGLSVSFGAVGGFSVGGVGGAPIVMSTAAVAYGTVAGTVGMSFGGTLTNGATPGTTILQWAQNTSDAGNLILLKNSLVRVTRIA